MAKILSQSPAPCNQAAQLSSSSGKAPTGVKATANPANHHRTSLLSYLKCEDTITQLAWQGSPRSKSKSVRADVFTWFKTGAEKNPRPTVGFSGIRRKKELVSLFEARHV